MKQLLLAAGILLQAARAFGQAAPAPAFEAASIKPSQDPPGSSSGITTTKGRISARNVTLKRCVRGAYGVEEPRMLEDRSGSMRLATISRPGRPAPPGIASS